jgi:hypothetical protein
VGNEIDAFNADAEHPLFWSDYGVFLDKITQHCHTSYPGLEVGFVATLHGLTDPTTQLSQYGVWTAYAGVVDVIAATYYPLQGNFQVEDPSVASAAFDLFVSAFDSTGVRLRLQELGYHTGAAGGSDNAKQEEFFCNAWQAWDMHRDVIRSVNIVRLNDVAPVEAYNLADPYGLHSVEFEQYLETLGLQTNSGVSKPALQSTIDYWTATDFIATPTAAAMPTDAATPTAAPVDGTSGVAAVVPFGPVFVFCWL